MAITILICGWLFKAACIQTGSRTATSTRAASGPGSPCYTDVVPLYGSHELDIGALPYKTSCWTTARSGTWSTPS